MQNIKYATYAETKERLRRQELEKIGHGEEDVTPTERAFYESLDGIATNRKMLIHHELTEFLKRDAMDKIVINLKTDFPFTLNPTTAMMHKQCAHYAQQIIDRVNKHFSSYQKTTEDVYWEVFGKIEKYKSPVFFGLRYTDNLDVIFLDAINHLFLYGDDEDKKVSVSLEKKKLLLNYVGEEDIQRLPADYLEEEYGINSLYVFKENIIMAFKKTDLFSKFPFMINVIKHFSEPISKKQIEYLRSRGDYYEIPTVSSKLDATSLIGVLLFNKNCYHDSISVPETSLGCFEGEPFLYHLSDHAIACILDAF